MSLIVRNRLFVYVKIKTQISFAMTAKLRAIPEKNTWGGRRQTIYFSRGGRCAHFSNYIGPWCLTNSDYIGGGVRPISNSVWVVVLHSLRRGEERILSANRLINVAIRKLRSWQNRSKSGHFCFCLHM